MVAFAYYHKKLYDTAELVLDDLFKRDAAKQNANVYYVYGLVYDHTNRPEQAVLSYKKALELNPNHASALVNLGVHQLQNTQYAEAHADLRAAGQPVRPRRRRDPDVARLGLPRPRRRLPGGPARSATTIVRRAEAAYKRALQANAELRPGLLQPRPALPRQRPVPRALRDALHRLNAAKSYFDQYKNMPGVDMKLYDERMKDVTKAIKRAEKQQKKSRGAPDAGGTARPRPGWRQARR